MSKREPIVPLTAEQRDYVKSAPAYVVLVRKPGSNTMEGYVEESFNMAYSLDYVYLYRSATYQSILGEITLDGEAEATDAASTVKRYHPDWDVEWHDVRSDDCPILIDWETWIDALARNPNTFSGVSDKFKARNAPFRMKDEDAELLRDANSWYSDGQKEEIESSETT